jgi:hypothetical protein
MNRFAITETFPSPIPNKSRSSHFNAHHRYDDIGTMQLVQQSSVASQESLDQRRSRTLVWVVLMQSVVDERLFVVLGVNPAVGTKRRKAVESFMVSSNKMRYSCFAVVKKKILCQNGG